MKNIKEILALLLTINSVLFIWYILVHFGHEKEILTLIIGLISGTILGSIMGTYFSSTHNRTQPPTNTDIQSIEVTQTTTTDGN